MTTPKGTVWLVLGESESGDRDQWAFAGEPSMQDLLDIVRDKGDDAGVSDLVSVEDLDEQGYLLDEEALTDPDEGVLPGPGFGGSYWYLSVVPTPVPDRKGEA